MISIPPASITYLEMRSPVEIIPKRDVDGRFLIRECPVELWQLNQFLYLAVGESCAWNDKRDWSDEQWHDYAGSRRLRTFVSYFDGAPIGYFELHENDARDIEIAHFGLLPEYFGLGLGGALLTKALEVAWESEPQRVWLHTCASDHQTAVPNYLARGMKVYKTEANER